MASVGVCFCGGREYSGDCVGLSKEKGKGGRRKAESSDFNYFLTLETPLWPLHRLLRELESNGGSQMACGLPPDLPGASPSVLHHHLLVCAIVGRVVCVVAVCC